MQVWYHTRALGSCALSGPDGWGPDAMETCGSHLKSVCSTFSDHIRGSYRTILLTVESASRAVPREDAGARH